MKVKSNRKKNEIKPLYNECHELLLYFPSPLSYHFFHLRNQKTPKRVKD